MIYNYVILGSSADYYSVTYDEIISGNIKSARYIAGRTDSGSVILNKLCRLHTSQKINRTIHLPLQNIWYPLYYRNSFDSNKPICFIIFAGRKYQMNAGYISYLRKKYDNCKIVLYCQDLISKWKTGYDSSFERIKCLFDLILTYDKGESERYGIYYYPLVYSTYTVPENAELPDTDVYFIGQAKDRLKDIVQVYERLREIGLVCDFNLLGVKPSEQAYCEEIHYLNNNVSYIENLQHVIKTKTILEVLQKGANGYTLRCCEAVTFGKRLLTNNTDIENQPFYSPSNMLAFSCADDICAAFFENDNIPVYENSKLSPRFLLEYIDNILTESIK